MHEEQSHIQEAERKLPTPSPKKDIFKKIANLIGKGLTSISKSLQLTALMDQYHQGNKSFEAVVKEGAELTKVKKIDNVETNDLQNINKTYEEMLPDLQPADDINQLSNPNAWIENLQGYELQFYEDTKEIGELNTDTISEIAKQIILVKEELSNCDYLVVSGKSGLLVKKILLALDVSSDKIVTLSDEDNSYIYKDKGIYRDLSLEQREEYLKEKLRETNLLINPQSKIGIVDDHISTSAKLRSYLDRFNAIGLNQSTFIAFSAPYISSLDTDERTEYLGDNYKDKVFYPESSSSNTDRIIKLIGKVASRLEDTTVHNYSGRVKTFGQDQLDVFIKKLTAEIKLLSDIDSFNGMADTEQRDYEEKPIIDIYNTLINPDWVEPTYEQLNQNVDIVQIPDNATKLIETAYAVLYVEKDARLIYRKIRWHQLQPGKDYTEIRSNDLHNQIKHKLYVAEKDTIGLTPKIIQYDEEGTIAMEFVEGITLTQFEGKLPLEVAKQFLENLDKFHQLGLYHGDIQTDHIIIQPNGKLRLIDPNYNEEAENPDQLIQIQKNDLEVAKIFMKRYVNQEDKLKI